MQNKRIKYIISSILSLSFLCGCEVEVIPQKTEPTTVVTTTTPPIYVAEGQYVDRNEITKVRTTTTEETEEEALLKGEKYWVLAEVDAECPVTISAVQNDKSKGISRIDNKSTLVDGSELEGELIANVSTCADFDGDYSGSYEILGDYLETITFSFAPTKEQQYDIGEYGINYFDMIQTAGSKKCDKVVVKYKEYIGLYSSVGEFKMTIYPCSTENAELYGIQKLDIRGTTGEVGFANIECGLSEEGNIVINSNQTIISPTLEITKKVNGEYITDTVVLDNTKTITYSKDSGEFTAT